MNTVKTELNSLRAKIAAVDKNLIYRNIDFVRNDATEEQVKEIFDALFSKSFCIYNCKKCPFAYWCHTCDPMQEWLNANYDPEEIEWLCCKKEIFTDDDED